MQNFPQYKSIYSPYAKTTCQLCNLRMHLFNYVQKSTIKFLFRANEILALKNNYT